VAINRLNPDYPDAGLVQMMPTSVAVGSGSSTVNGNGQVSFSGSSSVSLNGVFSSTYAHYFVIIDYSANGGGSTLRLRASSTDNSNANFIIRGWSVPDTAGGQYPIQLNSQTSMTLGTVSTSANFGTRTTMHIMSPQENKATGIYVDSAYSTSNSSGEGYFYRGTHRENYQADGFTLINPANMTGALSVYGYRN
jgi:hypothetical protein